MQEVVKEGNKPFVDSVEMCELKDYLMGFSGTEEYHREGLSVLFTDGVYSLIQKAECWWLISDISIVSQTTFPRVPFQLWVLRVKDMVGELTLREDTNSPVLYRQNYQYTDFPEGTFVMYLRDGVLMLPSEY